jgi:hypothetical protein
MANASAKMRVAVFLLVVLLIAASIAACLLDNPYYAALEAALYGLFVVIILHRLWACRRADKSSAQSAMLGIILGWFVIGVVGGLRRLVHAFSSHDYDKVQALTDNSIIGVFFALFFSLKLIESLLKSSQQGIQREGVKEGSSHPA